MKKFCETKKLLDEEDFSDIKSILVDKIIKGFGTDTHKKLSSVFSLQRKAKDIIKNSWIGDPKMRRQELTERKLRKMIREELDDTGRAQNKLWNAAVNTQNAADDVQATLSIIKSIPSFDPQRTKKNISSLNSIERKLKDTIREIEQTLEKMY